MCIRDRRRLCPGDIRVLAQTRDPPFWSYRSPLAALDGDVQDQRVDKSVWKTVMLVVAAIALSVATAVGLIFVAIAIVAHEFQNQVDKLQEPASISSAQFHRVRCRWFRLRQGRREVPEPLSALVNAPHA